MTYTVQIQFPATVALEQIPVGGGFTPVGSVGSGNPPFYVRIDEGNGKDIPCMLVATGLPNWLPQVVQSDEEVYPLTAVSITAGF
jgi:hypothetical protein